MEEENLSKLSSVIIIVLGDIGHSPRMCNHAYSFASKNINVDLIGYLNSKPHENLCKNKNIRIHSMSQPPSVFSSRILFIRLLMLPLKFIWMFFSTLLTVTAILNKPKENKNSLMLVQNPPGLPTMFVCYLISKFYKMLYVIDWHNYTFSMLRMSILFEPLEGLMGRLSDLNICVSRAMQNDLKYRWGIKATVFYDRPPDYLFKFEKEEKCQFLERFILDPLITAAILESKIFETEIREGLFMQNLPTGEINEKRPFLLISSTSWTPDEDFSILLNALKYYDNYCNSKTLNFPKIFVIITGKGPQKEMYLERIKNTKWINVFILTAWLDAEDYPKLLSCADIGVCLHTSTTGLDLPMKIVDMFGCHLPVLAKKFNAITELVEDGVNGILFDTDKELSDALIKLTGDFPKNELLNQIHNNLSDGISSWEENWEVILGPLFGITN